MDRSSFICQVRGVEEKGLSGLGTPGDMLPCGYGLVSHLREERQRKKYLAVPVWGTSLGLCWVPVGATCSAYILHLYNRTARRFFDNRKRRGRAGEGRRVGPPLPAGDDVLGEGGGFE